MPDESPETVAALIKEVRVTNLATGQSISVPNPTDVDIEVDIDLNRNVNNAIEIRVIDINDRIVSRSVSLQVR